jgi:hypothetical protein
VHSAVMRSQQVRRALAAALRTSPTWDFVPPAPPPDRYVRGESVPGAVRRRHLALG